MLLLLIIGKGRRFVHQVRCLEAAGALLARVADSGERLLLDQLQLILQELLLLLSVLQQSVR